MFKSFTECLRAQTVNVAALPPLPLADPALPGSRLGAFTLDARDVAAHPRALDAFFIHDAYLLDGTTMRYVAEHADFAVLDPPSETPPEYTVEYRYGAFVVTGRVARA